MRHLKVFLIVPAMFTSIFWGAGASEMAVAAVPPTNLVFASRLAVHAGGCAIDLGDWAKVSGLGDSSIVNIRIGGDASNHRWYFPGALGLSTVKLTRTAGSDSQLVKDWLSDDIQTVTPTTVTITSVDLAGLPLATWTLDHALPVKWSLAAFDAGTSKVAIETLELSVQEIAGGSPCSRASSPLP
jgi:phage tail-like protein